MPNAFGRFCQPTLWSTASASLLCNWTNQDAVPVSPALRGVVRLAERS